MSLAPKLKDTAELAVEKPQMELNETVLIGDESLASILRECFVEVVQKDENGALVIKRTKDDPSSPRNFSALKRYGIVILVCALINLLCFGVSSYSTGIGQIAQEFDTSDEVAIVGLTLYIVGLSFGALVLAPLSECAPIANTGGVIHDLFSRDLGGTAMALYGLSSADGPPLGNVFGGYIAQNLGYKYIARIQLAIFGGFWVVIYFCLPETRESILMTRRATEIIYLSSLINALSFGIIFLANQAFPLIFGTGNGGHGWTSIGAVNLTYLAGFLLHPLQEQRYQTAQRNNGGKSVPEARFYSSLFGIWLLPIGLFIAAWTSFPSVNFMAPIVGFTMFGCGFYMILTAVLNFVVDGYGEYAASGLGAVVMARNLGASVFPLFTNKMFESVSLLKPDDHRPPPG
ncbi:hypothetical protein RQP46_001173 [Phenoliferia psychrophenolica]